ncbi:hypothetical protein BDW22DRAFT_1409320 [Trametopsis cervina]|nr:hypothetical protein BDW22DRAFT_1409320 [Trametopsis cervina]
MAQPQTYGQALPDQVDRIAALSDCQLDFLADVRDLFRERIGLEREYATKLQALARKAADKKSKKIATLIVGPDPAKPVDESVIKQSTLDKSYTQLIASFIDTASDHNTFADDLHTRISEALKATERRHEDAKKGQLQHYQRLLSERDKIYHEQQKVYHKYYIQYDAECSETMTYRQKQERSTDDRHAERAAKQAEQQRVDMHNSKNMYLISTSVANKTKGKFYEEDLPVLEDNLQTQLLAKFSSIILEAQSLHILHLDALKTRVVATESAVRELDSQLDQQIFINHNIRAFSPPSDFGFEPCATYYDTDEMIVEPAPKVYLQNRLAKCRQKMDELNPIVEAKRRDVDQLAKLVEAYAENDALGNVDEVSDNYLEAHHQLSYYLISQRALSAEVETVTAALEGDEGSQQFHTFKSSSFSIPTQCAYCKASSSIWGLSKQGKTCKDCGISVHSKCELKLPATCVGHGGKHGHGYSHSISSTISRATSRASATPSLVTPTPSSFSPTDLSASTEESHLTARVLFSFTPTSPFELEVTEGAFVEVLEDDDGSGWVKVLDESGGKGLVPASYVETQDTAPSPHGKKTSDYLHSVRALYDYDAQGAGELSLQEGQIIQLTDEPRGGRNYADGWWEGINEAGKKGIFPSNYVCRGRAIRYVLGVL